MMARAVLIAALAAPLLTAPTPAKEVEGVRFATELRAGELRMLLNNVGLLRYRVVIKAYVAALYLGEGVEPAQVLDDVPKRLEAEYFWNIDGEDFGPATLDGIAKNVDPPTLERLRPTIERFAALFDDVKPGDRYALTYLPGRGTEVSLNGVPKGTAPGADFAAALFSIWLGRVPIDESLKAALLARN